MWFLFFASVYIIVILNANVRFAKCGYQGLTYFVTCDFSLFLQTWLHLHLLSTGSALDCRLVWFIRPNTCYFIIL